MNVSYLHFNRIDLDRTTACDRKKVYSSHSAAATSVGPFESLPCEQTEKINRGTYVVHAAVKPSLASSQS